MHIPTLGRLLDGAAFLFARTRLGETVSADPVLGSLGVTGLKYNPDDLVGKRGLAVYDEMQHDAQVQACLTIKKLSILSRGWQVHPASDDAQDVAVADFVRWVLLAMRGSILDVLYNVLDALAKGFSVLEINYALVESGPYAGRIGLESVKSKDPSSFLFETDRYMNVTALRQRGAPGEPAYPPDKFLLYTYRPSYESPYGVPDLRAAYRHYWSKDLLVRFMNLYLEKYGSPTAKGTYRRGTPRAAQEELLKVLDRIKQQTAIVVPDDVAVELMEARRGGEAGYLAALEWHDKQIAKAILGQTLMTDEGMRVGSFAMAKVHLDILKMCLRKLKRDLEESVMSEQLIRRLVKINFGDVATPTFCLGPLEDRDFETVANAVTKLVSGEIVAPDEAWIRESLGIPAKGEGT